MLATNLAQINKWLIFKLIKVVTFFPPLNLLMGLLEIDESMLVNDGKSLDYEY